MAGVLIMFERRAQTILARGVTPKVLRGRTMKSVASIKERIDALSLPYVDVDNSVEGAKQVLMAAFGEFERHIMDTQKYLEEVA